MSDEGAQVPLREIEGVVVRPGDTVLMRLPQRTPAQDLHREVEALRKAMPADTTIVLLAHDCQLLVMRHGVDLVDLGDDLDDVD